MKMRKLSLLLLLISSGGIAMDMSSIESAILAPSIKNTINILYPTTLCYTRSGTTLVAATSNYEVCVCNPHAKEPDLRIPVKDYVYALDTNPQHSDLIAMQDASNEISVYDIRELRYVRQIENPAGSTMLKYNNDGNELLVTTNQNGCNLVDVRSKSITAVLPDTKINGAYYNPVHNNNLAIMNDEAVQLYDIRAGKSTNTIPLTSSLINIAFNKYGNKIIASCTGDLALLNATT
jgi:WD40 repeat protein